MHSSMLAAGAVCAAASIMLCGCGESDEPVKQDACDGYTASNVTMAFDNHLGAFGSFDVDKIMCDYDETSMVSLFNDKCIGEKNRSGYAEFKGTVQIRGFFEDMFKQLQKASNLDEVGPVEGAAVVQEGAAPEGNVFLTWRTKNLPPSDDITHATDTFSFRVVNGKYNIWKQNIVATMPGRTCADFGSATDPPKEKTGIYAAWENHFSAFGSFDVDKILVDYTEESVVQVFDATIKKYEEFKGLTRIREMFTKLFVDITAGADDDGELGIKVPLQQVEPDYNGVFLVWESFSHPKATDTFVFDDKHKIIRQNIVVQTKVMPQSGAMNIQLQV